MFDVFLFSHGWSIMVRIAFQVVCEAAGGSVGSALFVIAQCPLPNERTMIWADMSDIVLSFIGCFGSHAWLATFIVLMRLVMILRMAVVKLYCNCASYGLIFCKPYNLKIMRRSNWGDSLPMFFLTFLSWKAASQTQRPKFGQPHLLPHFAATIKDEY